MSTIFNMREPEPLEDEEEMDVDAAEDQQSGSESEEDPSSPVVKLDFSWTALPKPKQTVNEVNAS